MKKTGILLAVILFLITSLAACSPSAPDRAATENGDSFHIIATIFPEYDWVREILGENPAGADVKLLLNNGVDMHSFQPSVKDITEVSGCDLFLYVGGESDEWVQDALEEAVNPDLIAVNLLDVLGDRVREEETVEGMKEERGERGHDEEEEEEPEYDEHVWLSLGNAEVLCEAIADALGEMDPQNAAYYRENADAYIRELSELDAEYHAAADSASVRTLLFADRFPFRYLTEDCGLNYYAAFAGCSAETEASFDTIVFLSDKMNELSLSHILTIEGADQRLARTIISNTDTKDQDILTMNSMQSVTQDELDSGETYLSIMKQNLDVLKRALE